jgi:MYXO-CTERM domain-containing protein
MDFIERLFGLSPDNGDGSTEILWLVALAVAVAVFVYVRRRRHSS